MNKNIIENIVARGGTEGWDTDVYAMKKSFEFDSFEECQAFCKRVAADANDKDHHPEWTLSNGGRTVDVTLTSHFAQNTVTRLDFELAEAMNNAYIETRGSFKLFPLLSDKQWSSLKIGAGMLVCGFLFFRLSTGSKYEEKPQGAPIPVPTEYTSPLGQASDLQLLADMSVQREASDYAYGVYEKSTLRPIAKS